MFKSEKGSGQMRIRTIAAALVVAAPLLAVGSPQAAACWETGYRYGGTPVGPRRYGYMSYGYSSPAYYGGYYGGVGVRRVGIGRVGVRRVGVGRVGVGRVGRRR